MEPVAIVGVAGRWPGANNLTELRELLFEGRRGESEVPDYSYNIKSFYHPDKDRPGSVPMKKGYFLNEDSRKFDNGFFGVNPAETKTLDPVQRQLLEVSYECLESAGITLEEIANSRTGCFIGNGGSDYPLMRSQDTDYGTVKPYGTTGTAGTMTSNRVSYVFNLKGPSITIDTACSSSIYALHMACNSLLVGDCTAALVGGINLIVGPHGQQAVAKLGVLSPTSTCHTFDAAADGYARAEGCGVLLIKLLKDAVKDKDPIRAIIRGTATNSNGQTGGITHPSSESQETVIKEAYRRAGITDFGRTVFFECHATGTVVGDPIEIEAVGRVFKQHREKSAPLPIGSVKSNLGHSEAACGIAHILKAIIMLESRCIPPTVGVKKLNPRIDFESNRVRVITKTTPLLPKDGVLRISINNSGFGGANAHVLLESVESFLPSHEISQISKWDSRKGEKPVQSDYDQNQCRRQNFLLPFSANSDISLRSNISRLKVATQDYDSADVAFTLGTKRSHLHHRAFGTVSGNDYSTAFRNVVYGKKRHEQLKIGLVFTGQSAQWPQMGVALMNEFPVFLLGIRELDCYLQQLQHPPSWGIEEILRDPPEKSRVLESGVGQTVCTAVQISLVNLLIHWGIRAITSVGHSSGEIAAAYSVGMLTAHQAILVAYYRGMSIEKVGNDGAMLAVGLGKNEVSPYLLPGVTLGCENSHRSVTLTGDRCAVEEVHKKLLAGNVFSRLLKTGGKAYHSEQMKQVGEEYQSLIEQIYESNTISNGDQQGFGHMVSSIDGQIIKDAIPPSYWRRNLESLVLFDQAIQAMMKEFGVTHIVEVGPHHTLQAPLNQILQQLDTRSVQYLFTMTRGEMSPKTVLDLAGQLYIQGYPIDLRTLNSPAALSLDGALIVRDVRIIIDLPGYSWDHQLLWDENRLSHEYRNRPYPRHELLGARLPYGSTTLLVWRNILRLKDVPWVDDHKKHGRTVLPAAGYLVMAIEALEQAGEQGLVNGSKTSNGYCLKEVSFSAPLNLDDEGQEVLLSLSAMRTSAMKRSKCWYEFSIISLNPVAGTGGDWTENCAGCVGFADNSTTQGESSGLVLGKDASFADEMISIDSDEFYQVCAENGTQYGPRFRLLKDITWNKRLEQLSGTVDLEPSNAIGSSRYIVEPIALDCAFQMASAAAGAGMLKECHPEVPSFITFLTVNSTNAGCEKSPSQTSIRSTARQVGVRGVRGEWVLETLDTVIACDGIKFVRYPHELAAQKDQIEEKHPYYRLIWKPDITTLNSSSARRAIAHNVTAGPAIPMQQELLSLLELYVHKNPFIRILQIGVTDYTHRIFEILNVNTSFRRFKDLVILSPEGSEMLPNSDDVNIYTSLQDIKAFDAFDLIIVPEHTTLSHKEPIIQFLGRQCVHGACAIVPIPLLRPLQPYFSKGVSRQFQIDNYSFLGGKIVPVQDHAVEQQITVVHPDDGINCFPNFITVLENEMISRGWKVAYMTLADVAANLVPSTNVISLVDLEGNAPALENVHQTTLDSIKELATNASTIWLTKGDIMDAADPASALIFGMTRTVAAEEPGLRFLLLDYDPQDLVKRFCHAHSGSLEQQERQKHQQLTCIEILCDRAIQFFTSLTTSKLEEIRPDREFSIKDDIMFISRYIPDMFENERYNKEHNRALHRYKPDLIQCRVGDIVAKMKLEEIGQFDSLCFIMDTKSPDSLGPDEVEFRVKASTINQKGVVILMGIFEPDQPAKEKPYHSSFEHAGTVIRVGERVTDLRPGDTVVSCWQGDYGTVERAPAYACQIVSAEEAIDAVTIPVAYMTVLYAFRDLARLEENETVLIHSAAGPVGIAAIRMALLVGAKVYATVSSDAKRDFLQEAFGLSRERIFQSRDRSFVRNIMEATQNKGVDVILSAHTGDLLHDTWQCLAHFGRYVDIGRRDVLDYGRLNMNMFANHASFFSFDLGIIGWQKPKLFQKLFADVFEQYRSGRIKPIQPIKVFDVSQLPMALRSYMKQEHVGKIVIDYSNPHSLVPCQPAKADEVAFKQQASYLIIGGLGGLGQSLTKWMLGHGARHFVFLSRSGNQDGSAAKILDAIHDQEGTASVVKGDVSKMADCSKAIDAATYPLKGVIHAAMVLKDGLFSQSKADDFNAVLRPKHIGAMNLHETLKNHDMDFFLMMSSIAAAAGTMGQHNYAAANASLDSLARLRHHVRLPAVSVALGAIAGVGILSKHEALLAQLVRVGISPMTESEYLGAIELGIRSQLHEPVNAGVSCTGQQATLNERGITSYILTGVGPGLYQNIAFRRDPRFNLIVNAIRSNEKAPKGNRTKTQGADLLEDLKTCSSENDRIACLKLLTSYVTRKISDILMKPIEQINPERSAYTYGLDSLVGGELRIWIYHVFKVDVAFFEISHPNCSISKLAETILERTKL